jgi:iron(III) transport system substrate-binding protein
VTLTTLFAAAMLAAGAAQAQEGPLVIYTATPTEQMDELVAAFNESYPDVQVEYFRSGTTEVMNRMNTSTASSKVTASDPST